MHSQKESAHTQETYTLRSEELQLSEPESSVMELRFPEQLFFRAGAPIRRKFLQIMLVADNQYCMDEEHLGYKEWEQYKFKSTDRDKEGVACIKKHMVDHYRFKESVVNELFETFNQSMYSFFPLLLKFRVGECKVIFTGENDYKSYLFVGENDNYFYLKIMYDFSSICEKKGGAKIIDIDGRVECLFRLCRKEQMIEGEKKLFLVMNC